ncbi:MAG: glycosyltransferase family 39 protein [Candidatus Latescibacteria bacterium]|nr:glycosyltransferase family 39 protein [Candidatus Latescibacterota bacterium]
MAREGVSRSGLQGYALVAILVLEAVVRVSGIGFGLPNTETRPDETVAVSVAMHMAKSGLHPHFFDYPTLFPTVLLFFYSIYFLVGYGLGWFSSLEGFKALYYTDPSSFYLIARLVSAGCGVATIHLVYVIGRRVYGVRAGLLSALFLAVCPIHVRDSHFGKVDVPMTCLVVLSGVYILDLYRNGRFRDYVLSGVAVGLAASTKYPAGVFCVSVVVAHFLRGRGAGGLGVLFGGWRWTPICGLPPLRRWRLFSSLLPISSSTGKGSCGAFPGYPKISWAARSTAGGPTVRGGCIM